jgi:hypothetical protein
MEVTKETNATRTWTGWLIREGARTSKSKEMHVSYAKVKLVHVSSLDEVSS